MYLAFKVQSTTDGGVAMAGSIPHYQSMNKEQAPSG